MKDWDKKTRQLLVSKDFFHLFIFLTFKTFILLIFYLQFVFVWKFAEFANF